MIKPDVETVSDGVQLVFPAIWLARNESCWRAFVIMSTKSENGGTEMDYLGYKETNSLIVRVAKVT